jgi:hypothetical protein
LLVMEKIEKREVAVTANATIYREIVTVVPSRQTWATQDAVSYQRRCESQTEAS